MKRITRIKKLYLSLLKKRQKETVIDLALRYHIIGAADELLLATNNFHEAWLRIRGERHGCRLVRNDGELLAYASTVQGARVKKGFPDKVRFIGKLSKKDSATKKKGASKKAPKKAPKKTPAKKVPKKAPPKKTPAKKAPPKKKAPKKPRKK